jgi:hypothetical protein
MMTHNDVEISKFWQAHELDSKDKDGTGRGTWVNFNKEFLLCILRPLRVLTGKPFVFTSAYRTPNHNRSIGGAPQSAHLQGLAVDLSTKGWTKEERRSVMVLARKLGVTGIGVHSNFIHMDVAKRTASWRYANGQRIPLKVGEEVEWA